MLRDIFVGIKSNVDLEADEDLHRDAGGLERDKKLYKERNTRNLTAIVSPPTGSIAILDSWSSFLGSKSLSGLNWLR